MTSRRRTAMGAIPSCKSAGKKVPDGPRHSPAFRPVACLEQNFLRPGRDAPPVVARYDRFPSSRSHLTPLTVVLFQSEETRDDVFDGIPGQDSVSVLFDHPPDLPDIGPQYREPRRHVVEEFER